MAFYLGIDGGGTKTRCVLADETTILARVICGGSNIVRLGETQVRQILRSAVQQVCATARISPEQVRACCIGAAGAARPEVAANIRKIFTNLGIGNVEVVGDTVIARHAAFGAGAGVIVIAGTGSIAYGRDAAGHIARAGGWGFAISDEGSGHWIGRSAVSAILNAHDRGLETALTSLVLSAWRLGSIDELVQQANSTPGPDFPRLFVIVLQAAEQGDSIARGLLAEAAIKLAALAEVVIRRLTPDPVDHASARDGILPVATTGSVFRQSAEVRQVFYNVLQTNFPGIQVRGDLAEPVEGALARARELKIT